MADTLERRTISLRGARRVLDAAIAEAERIGKPVSVAVIGADGQLKAFAAMDGTTILSTETARKKAMTVIKVGKATSEFAESLKADMKSEPELFHGMLGMDGIATFGGGVPIMVGDQRVGAVAVSGASSAEDDEIARKAAAVVEAAVRSLTSSGSGVTKRTTTRRE